MIEGVIERKMEKTVILPFEPVQELRPKYLNSFRNTPHYQNSLARGVQVENEIIPVTLTDILGASDVMKHVFTGTVAHAGREYEIKFRNGLYLSPTMRVVAAEDKVNLTRELNPNAFREPLETPEVIFGYAKALERLSTYDRTLKKTKKAETREERQWCIDRLTELAKSKDGLNALTLWLLFRGEGDPRIKSTRTALETYQNIITYLSEQLRSAHKMIAEYTRKELEE